MKSILAAFVAVASFAAVAMAGPLHDAARDGDTERVKQLLDQGT